MSTICVIQISVSRCSRTQASRHRGGGQHGAPALPIAFQSVFEASSASPALERRPECARVIHARISLENAGVRGVNPPS